MDRWQREGRRVRCGRRSPARRSAARAPLPASARLTPILHRYDYFTFTAHSAS
jgi:hypothetical protein